MKLIKQFIKDYEWMGEDDRHTEGFRNGIKFILLRLKDEYVDKE